MAGYHVNNDFGGTKPTISTSQKTHVAVFSVTGALCRGRVTQISVGPFGAPVTTDCNVIWSLPRQTADGTGTTATPNPIVTGDPTTPRSTAKVNYSAEGTYGSPPWGRPINQRSTLQWVGPDEDTSPTWPATNLAGFALTCKGADSSFTSTVFGAIDFEEL